MFCNYHTHTFRCGHATGTDREYVENAIKIGLKTLGFSDHAPYIFEDGYRSSMRMSNDQINDYANSIRSLAKEYQNDIKILLGFELEYYPDFYKEEKAFLKTVNPDYYILGQHYLHCEYGYSHVFKKEKRPDAVLQAYATQIIAGLDTGDFLYLAHPDMIGTNFSKEVVEREFYRICAFAKKRNIPLEINLCGVRGNREYPCDEFFQIAGRVGNDVVIGYDAHDAKDFLDNTAKEKAFRLIEKHKLNLIDLKL